MGTRVLIQLTIHSVQNSNLKFIFIHMWLYFLCITVEHAERIPIKSYVADICDTEALADAFKNVNIVFHLAAYIDFQYPPNVNELERVNVNGKSQKKQQQISHENGDIFNIFYRNKKSH